MYMGWIASLAASLVEVSQIGKLTCNLVCVGLHFKWQNQSFLFPVRNTRSPLLYLILPYTFEMFNLLSLVVSSVNCASFNQQQRFFRVSYLKRKKRNLYRITLLAVSPASTTTFGFEIA